MTVPYYQDDWLTVYHGDCREVMAAMEPESVHCVVTSPPYWGLRDYGTSGQLGLEPTPEEYVANLVAVFREVRRVLRADGTVWLNLGDSYASGTVGRNDEDEANLRRRFEMFGTGRPKAGRGLNAGKTRPLVSGLKPKDLVGIPWRVAFALQADGWYLRSDIIWSKPNPMPESVTDRPTKSHEYIFLLSKSARYYFDADAVREPHIEAHLGRYGYDFWSEGTKEANGSGRPGGVSNTSGAKQPNPLGRNIRSVWTMATQPYPGAHFATFPETLPERCIKAGTSEKGVCPECGAPWERVVERQAIDYGMGSGDTTDHKAVAANGNARKVLRTPTGHTLSKTTPATVGWRPTCACCAMPDCILPTHGRHTGAVPATVLDPFAGSGTTGMVAQSLSRRAVLIDLSLDYLGQLMARNADIPLGLGA